MKKSSVLLTSFALFVAPLMTAACGGDDGSPGDGDGDTGDGDGDAGDGDGDGDGDGLGGNPGDGDGDGLGGAQGDGDGDAPVGLTNSPQDPECNLSGVWAIVAKTRTAAGGGEQVANRWFLYEISHDGASVTVERSFNCGVRVQNDGGIIATTVTISDDALLGIVTNDSHAGLEGTFVKNGEGCDLDMDRVYFVLGADGALFLPEDPSTRPALSELPDLPNEDDTTGAEDWDGDGNLGLAFDVNSVLDGTRNSVQRAYQEFDSDSTNEDYTIALSSTTFTVNNLTAIEESVLSHDPALDTLGTLEGTDHPVTFTRLGDTHATAVLPSGDPLPETDLEICQALEAEFPYSL